MINVFFTHYIPFILFLNTVTFVPSELHVNAGGGATVETSLTSATPAAFNPGDFFFGNEYLFFFYIVIVSEPEPLVNVI